LGVKFKFVLHILTHNTEDDRTGTCSWVGGWVLG